MTITIQMRITMLCMFMVICSACSSSSDDTPGDINAASNIPEQQDPVELSPAMQGPDSNPATEPDPQAEPALPPFATGSDLENLLLGLTRLVSNTLLELNQTLSSGLPLTAQQQGCLVGFEPGLGEPLLSFECNSAPLLATINSNAVRLAISNGALVDTRTCKNSLFNDNSMGCHLLHADINLSTEWVVPAQPELPYPVAGVQLRYALAESSLTLNSIEGAPTPPFSCEIDLQTALPVSTDNDCDAAISLAAERLDTLVP